MISPEMLGVANPETVLYSTKLEPIAPEGGNIGRAAPSSVERPGRVWKKADVRSLAVAGVDHFERGELEEAAESFRAMLQADPANIWALKNLGVTLIQLKQFQSVRETFERLVRYLGARGAGAYELASAHQAIGAALINLWASSNSPESAADLASKALSEFSKVIELQPDYPGGWLGRGMAFHIMDRLDEAEAALRSALDVSPGNPVVIERLRGVLEDKLEKRLFELGYLSKRNEPIRDFTAYENRKLVEVAGKPLSETIIEERR